MQNPLGDNPEQITHSMADAMRLLGEGCTEFALKLKGFTQQEIARYGDAAREVAFKQSARHIRVRIASRAA
ncbi:hypothetical protein B0E45_06030 [Sinorhizobium sp. A49]|uniref:hypothetical protein n=1 Tax=Sinorhizobium sp. A49 TaxID=1945861 RepID=UPI0009842510|nr:hypothetical protein [Sinorhizobium sp. A49]OOG73851.1 hypothetical protein B0E45_06030 [Sinorhizobium sp. A49]